MVERIRTLLQSRQLTPTQFADAIGVARPIVSHILSGRNKPSLEVVQKVVAAFPDLSLSWLLSGIEPMLAPVVAADSIRPALAPPQVLPVTDVVEVPAKRIRAASAKPLPITTAVGNGPAPAAEPLLLPEPAVAAAIASQVVPAAQPAPAASAAQGLAVGPPPTLLPNIPSLAGLVEPGKKIRRIVIFYQDGTFGDYQPE